MPRIVDMPPVSRIVGLCLEMLACDENSGPVSRMWACDENIGPVSRIVGLCREEWASV